MKKKWTACLAAVLAMVLVFAACGNPAADGGNADDKSPTTPAPAEGEEAVTLRYMTWEDGDWQKFSEDFIAQYMEQNPHVTVQYEPTAGSEYMTKLKTMLSAGNPPDVVWVDGWQELISRGVFEPLDAYIEKHGFDISAQNPELIDMVTHDGHIYGLFGWAGVTAIYYNKELFDEAGVPYPQEGWTWDDMKEIARQLTKGEGADKVYGIELPLDWIGAFETIMWGNGARLIDDNLQYDGVMNSALMAEAIDWYTSFVREGLAPQPASAKSMGGAEEMFKTGKLAMMYGFSGFIQSVKVNGGFDLDKLGVIHLPVANKGDKPAVNTTFTNPIMITKDSKNKDEAFKFLAARVGDETQREFVSLGWTVPSNANLVYELNMLDDPLLRPFVDPLVNRDKYVYPKPVGAYSPLYSAITENMVNAISKIVIRGDDPQAALDEAVANVKKIEADRQ
jgi:ABC-type sugar transport system, periplasmic component